MIRWLQVTSGRGPAECCWVVARVVQCITKEAETLHGKVNVLQFVPGDEPKPLMSAPLALEGGETSTLERMGGDRSMDRRKSLQTAPQTKELVRGRGCPTPPRIP